MTHGELVARPYVYNTYDRYLRNNILTIHVLRLIRKYAKQAHACSNDIIEKSARPTVNVL